VASAGNHSKAWLLLLVLLAGLGFAGWWWLQNRFAVKGIDVSHYQGEIDWPTVKASGIAFAFIKATEGTDNVDEMFATNWKAAGKAKVARGAYHFFHPNLDGAAQARHFLAHATHATGDLPPVLDLEETDDATAATIRQEALVWCEAVETAWGVKPIIYTLPHFANSYLDGKLSKYPLWVVDLGLLSIWPSDSKGWPKWSFWQHSHRGSVPGIVGDVDLDVFNGSTVEFQLTIDN
jgi:lysozyme